MGETEPRPRQADSLFGLKSLTRVAKSKPLFLFMIEQTQPDLIMDIGSRDGRESLEFRQRAPGSRIIAFEANPDLYARMRLDQRLSDGQIFVEHCAVSNAEGEASFSVFNPDRGTGSLLPRLEAESGTNSGEKFSVRTMRIDTHPEVRSHKRIALWIDAEGCSFEVLEGAQGILDSVEMIHVEVELREYWKDQKLGSDIADLMTQHGFVALFNRTKKTNAQANVIYTKPALVERFGTLGSFTAFTAFAAKRRVGRFGNPSPNFAPR